MAKYETSWAPPPTAALNVRVALQSAADPAGTGCGQLTARLGSTEVDANATTVIGVTSVMACARTGSVRLAVMLAVPVLLVLAKIRPSTRLTSTMVVSEEVQTASR